MYRYKVVIAKFYKFTFVLQNFANTFSGRFVRFPVVPKRLPTFCLPATMTKCLKDPTCAIFLKRMGFKDIKYDIPVYQM